MSYWSAVGLGLGVGVAAALVRVAVFFTRVRPPWGWISDLLRGALYLLPGAVVAIAATDSTGTGFTLWGGSLVSGLTSLVFPVYIPESVRPRRDAAIAIGNAERSGDKETVVGYLESPFPIIREYAVGAIRQRAWREYAPDLVRRLDVETDGEVRTSIAIALGYFAEPSTSEALAALVSDADIGVRRMGHLGLSRMGDARATGSARELYATGNSLARTQAIWGLLILGTPEAKATLDSLLASEPSWRRRRQARAVMRRFAKAKARGKRL